MLLKEYSLVANNTNEGNLKMCTRQVQDRQMAKKHHLLSSATVSKPVFTKSVCLKTHFDLEMQGNLEITCYHWKSVIAHCLISSLQSLICLMVTLLFSFHKLCWNQIRVVSYTNCAVILSQSWTTVPRSIYYIVVLLVL